MFTVTKERSMQPSSSSQVRRSSEKTPSDEKGGVETLEVTVIPVDEEPYQKTIKITPQMITGQNSSNGMNPG